MPSSKPLRGGRSCVPSSSAAASLLVTASPALVFFVARLPHALTFPFPPSRPHRSSKGGKRDSRSGSGKRSGKPARGHRAPAWADANWHPLAQVVSTGQIVNKGTGVFLPGGQGRRMSEGQLDAVARPDQGGGARQAAASALPRSSSS